MNRCIKGNENVSIIDIIVILSVVGAVLTALFGFYNSKTSINIISAEKTVKTVVSEEVIKTIGDWSFVPTDKRDFHLRFDFSSIPEILDRFERGHPNLSIKDWDIMYDTVVDGPHGIIIRHTPK